MQTYLPIFASCLLIIGVVAQPPPTEPQTVTPQTVTPPTQPTQPPTVPPPTPPTQPPTVPPPPADETDLHNLFILLRDFGDRLHEKQAEIVAQGHLFNAALATNFDFLPSFVAQARTLDENTFAIEKKNREPYYRAMRRMFDEILRIYELSLLNQFYGSANDHSDYLQIVATELAPIYALIGHISVEDNMSADAADLRTLLQETEQRVDTLRKTPGFEDLATAAALDLYEQLLKVRSQTKRILRKYGMKYIGYITQ